MVDGSNESLYHADEEMQPLVRTFSPSQTFFQNLDVLTVLSLQVPESLSKFSQTISGQAREMQHAILFKVHVFSLP